MKSITIITVGYNESRNLPKLLKSLEYIKSKINVRHIYVDQESTDNSLEIAKNTWCEVYLHKNQWYADPDKKWAVEKLCRNDDYILILDCDEELTTELSDEIIEFIDNNGWYKICRIYLDIVQLWIIVSVCHQLRLFKKSWVTISDSIHEYIKPISEEGRQYYLKNHIINKDIRFLDNEIYSIVEKNNRYTDKELEKIWNISRWKIILFMVRKPVLWFFWFWIRYKLFFKWLNWWIYCKLMAQYQFLIYIKKRENISYKS